MIRKTNILCIGLCANISLKTLEWPNKTGNNYCSQYDRQGNQDSERLNNKLKITQSVFGRAQIWPCAVWCALACTIRHSCGILSHLKDKKPKLNFIKRLAYIHLTSGWWAWLGLSPWSSYFLSKCTFHISLSPPFQQKSFTGLLSSAWGSRKPAEWSP